MKYECPSCGFEGPHALALCAQRIQDLVGRLKGALVLERARGMHLGVAKKDLDNADEKTRDLWLGRAYKSLKEEGAFK